MKRTFRIAVCTVALCFAAAVHAQTLTAPLANQTVSVGQTATFTASVTGGPCNIRWNAGPQTIFQAASSTATYTTPLTTTAMNGESVIVEFYACKGGPLAVFSNRAFLTVASAVVLNSISIAPSTPTVAIGSTQAFIVIGKYSDGSSSQDVTQQAAWTSSVPAVATIGQGVATGVSVGQSTITASLQGFSAAMVLTVDLANVILLVNSTSTATFDDGSPLLLAPVNVQQANGTTAAMVGVVSSDSTGKLSGTLTINPNLADTSGNLTFQFGLPLFPNLIQYSVPVTQFQHGATGLTINLVLYKSNADVKSQAITFTP